MNVQLGFRPLTGRSVLKLIFKLLLARYKSFRPLTGRSVLKHKTTNTIFQSHIGFRPLTGRSVLKRRGRSYEHTD